MNQQGMAAAAVKPHLIADLVVGFAAALAAVAVAQAALPNPKGELAAPQAEHMALRGVQQVSTVAPTPVDLPDYVYGDPIDGYEVISPFGYRKLPWEQAGRLHAGVDIAAPAGYPVKATADGVVVRAGVDGGYGRFVEVRHAEGLTSLYAHLGGIADGVQPGAAVRLGDRIGQVGNTGSSTGAHLHFEIHDAQDRPMNPEMFMGRQFATLADLPLREAASIPRRVRVAYVSYIPKKKLELMAARKAEKAAEDAQQVASLDTSRFGGKRITLTSGKPTTVTLSRMAYPTTGAGTLGKPSIDVMKPTSAGRGVPVRPKVIHLEPTSDDAPVATWKVESGTTETFSDWSSSGG